MISFNGLMGIWLDHEKYKCHLYSTNYSIFFCGLQLTQLVTMYFNRLVSSNVLYNSLCVYEYIFFDEFGFDICIVVYFDRQLNNVMNQSLSPSLKIWKWTSFSDKSAYYLFFAE